MELALPLTGGEISVALFGENTAANNTQVIVTENWRDFPAAVLEEYGIETLGADDMLVGTYELFPSEAARALSRVRKRYRTPPMTASEFLFDLTKSGLPKLAATLRRDIEAL